MSEQKKNLKTNKKSVWKKIMVLLLLEFIISVVTAPLLVFYGPFDNIKSFVVGTVYTTSSHRYIAELFLSDDAIKRILGKDGFYSQTDNSEGSVVNNLDFKSQHSDKIDYLKIDGGSFKLKGYLLVIHDPTLVKIGYSVKLPVEGELTSTIAKRNGAIAAINAGGFAYDAKDGAWASTGGKFEGYIIHGGKVVGNNLESENVPYSAIGFNKKGQLIFGNYSIRKLKELGINEALCSFGPKLIVNGKKLFSAGETGGLGINPRTAIGQKANGEVLFFVVDGRNLLGSMGASMFDLQEVLYEQGAVNAINLDGGSSCAMYYNGKLVNRPSNAMGERAIPSIFMVAPGKEGTSK